MAIRTLSISISDKKSYQHILERGSQDLESTIQKVIPIIQKVKDDRDKAILELTKKFDGIELKKWVFHPSEIDTSSVPQELKDAFRKAYENIYEFHKNQIPKNFECQISGNSLGLRYIPMDSVTVYAPGGKALYPSSVLMGTIPAKIAGVENIQIATPPQKDGIPPILAFVAQLVGVDRIITVGGAQAIAACAYGTETIQPSSFIVGPGNNFVAAAKSYLAGKGIIGIESPAGPSEVFIIADSSANPEWIACDLLSQAEHGEDSIAILASDSQDLIQNVSIELDKALKTRTKRLEIKLSAIQNNSYLIKFPNLDECFEFANLFAPEHLEILTRNYKQDLLKIKNAGSVFLGYYSPVAMGDYITGTNHILPTGGTSRIYSSLGVMHFLKRITYQEVTKDSLKSLYPYVQLMSESEGLEEEHGYSVWIRTLDK